MYTSEVITRIYGLQSSDIASMMLSLSKLNCFNEDLVVTLVIEAAVSKHHLQQFSELHVFWGM